jgi:predicted phosphate transport protein (TIGR00153 family)
MRAFLPQEEDFFYLFRLAGDKAVEAAECLHSLMNNYQRLDGAVEDIDKIEHQADEIVHEVVHKLNTTFVTPALFDREDIYRLAECLDDVIDMIKGTVDRFRSFKIAQPTDHAVAMSELLLNAARLLQENIGELDFMQPGDNRCCRQINTLENEADAALKRALGELFDQEEDAREIIKWKEIYEFIEEAIDRCEDAANLIEAVITKNA